MPGWKALSDELDPDVRAFTERLRRLIDRSGLGVTAVAERTGHDRATWDACLDARRPVPRSAVAALAEVTGTDPGDLAAEWERAERGWSRSGRSDGGTVDADAGGAADLDDRTMQIRRFAAPDPAPAASPPPAPSAARRRPLLLYAVGTLGALLVVTAALLLVDLGGTDGTDDRAVAPPSPTTPTAAPSTSLPAGVKCAGAGCTGRDPEAMGCGGPLATTVARARAGAVQVEVRHSATCAAAWARISGATPGDTVTVSAGGATRRAEVVSAGADTDAYTPMLAVTAGTDATACATLADGIEHCTAN
ncbi:XRE family transcriptional regulator [Streptomyces sp. WAC01280]|uniref:helix-turn-helix domain-containing protein n=1 Tax=Streptomyces sp. WAC01280 TaxID=2487424 RepID=UPI000F792894|nr:XRE family transcriptional regulator [Streptomyces sp. WAC01280]RSS55075.1 XRE family transcriptional regulator [Streptomyces sp. WAC01280]